MQELANIINARIVHVPCYSMCALPFVNRIQMMIDLLLPVLLLIDVLKFV